MRANERLSAKGQRLAPLVAALAHKHLGAGANPSRVAREARKAYILTRMGQCENKTLPSPRQQLEELRAMWDPHRGVEPAFDHWFNRQEIELLELIGETR